MYRELRELVERGRELGISCEEFTERAERYYREGAQGRQPDSDPGNAWQGRQPATNQGNVEQQSGNDTEGGV